MNMTEYFPLMAVGGTLLLALLIMAMVGITVSVAALTGAELR